MSNSFEDILKIERKKLKITVNEMCDKANIPRQTYYYMRGTGFKSLRAAELLALANLFGCSTDYLLGRAETHNS